MDQKIVGILGGGQLGRMTAEAANRLNVKVAILDAINNPAVQVNSTGPHLVGSFRNPAEIRQLASTCDVITVEIEHVDVGALKVVEEGVIGPLGKPVVVSPSPNTIRIIQDKYVQKVHLNKFGVPLPAFVDAGDGKEVEGIRQVAEKGVDGLEPFGYPLMLKSKTEAYDGRGNRVVKSSEDVVQAVKDLGGGTTQNGPSLYVEKWVPFEKELAVMVVRSPDGTVRSYPCVETVQQNNVCHVVIAPAQIDGLLAERARKVAEKAIDSLDGAGIFGVEMFLLQNGEILLNEIAPRPHNSGHYTIEACHTSQFEQHLRAILGMPLGSTEMKVPAAAMVNLLGTASGDDGMNQILKPCKTALTLPGASVHLYGKAQCRAGRKMGHITIVGDTVPEVMTQVKELLKVMPGGETSAGPAINEARPVVGIIMGSDSDLPTMKPAAKILKDFGVPFEVTIVSAHRTPERMVEYAKVAHERGIQVIIAAAGGAAHLPGMVAALTPLPVIGVPVALRQLDGMDSLYSIVQMPRGVPVATVAINNSTNAALLAIRILGSSHPIYLKKIQEYQKKSEQEVLGKVETLKQVGWEEYE
ncbi:phosphoribosylaminoimidazole carboxylase ade2, partial [Chytridiales sp. JEL 0842]